MKSKLVRYPSDRPMYLGNTYELEPIYTGGYTDENDVRYYHPTKEEIQEKNLISLEHSGLPTYNGFVNNYYTYEPDANNTWYKLLGQSTSNYRNYTGLMLNYDLGYDNTPMKFYEQGYPVPERADITVDYITSNRILRMRGHFADVSINCVYNNETDSTEVNIVVVEPYKITSSTTTTITLNSTATVKGKGTPLEVAKNLHIKLTRFGNYDSFTYETFKFEDYKKGGFWSGIVAGPFAPQRVNYGAWPYGIYSVDFNVYEDFEIYTTATNTLKQIINDYHLQNLIISDISTDTYPDYGDTKIEDIEYVSTDNPNTPCYKAFKQISDNTFKVGYVSFFEPTYPRAVETEERIYHITDYNELYKLVSNINTPKLINERGNNIKTGEIIYDKAPYYFNKDNQTGFTRFAYSHRPDFSLGLAKNDTTNFTVENFKKIQMLNETPVEKTLDEWTTYWVLDIPIIDPTQIGGHIITTNNDIFRDSEGNTQTVHYDGEYTYKDKKYEKHYIKIEVKDTSAIPEDTKIYVDESIYIDYYRRYSTIETYDFFNYDHTYYSFSRSVLNTKDDKLMNNLEFSLSGLPEDKTVNEYIKTNRVLQYQVSPNEFEYSHNDVEYPLDLTGRKYEGLYLGDPIGDIFPGLFSFDESVLLDNVVYDKVINNSNSLDFNTVSSASINAELNLTPEKVELADAISLLYLVDGDNNNKGEHKGFFTITNVEGTIDNTTRIEAYDYSSRLNVYIDEWLETTNLPVSLLTFYHNLLDYCNIPYDEDETFINSDLMIYRSFTANKVTAWQIMTYIVQIAGGYFHIDKNGKAHISYYKEANV